MGGRPGCRWLRPHRTYRVAAGGLAHVLINGGCAVSNRVLICVHPRTQNLACCSQPDTIDLMRHVGQLSAEGSAVFHDAVSSEYIDQQIVVSCAYPGAFVRRCDSCDALLSSVHQVGGAPFIGGSDDYGGLWAQHAGFHRSYVRNFESVRVNRAQRRLDIDPTIPEATRKECIGEMLSCSWRWKRANKITDWDKTGMAMINLL